MAGIYISGLKMPTDKELLWIEIRPDGKVSYVFDLKCKEIAKAMPVPDHGRLGDLDKLESGLRLCAKYQTGDRQQGILGCCETIRTSPTIIPVDKEGD